MIQKVLEKYLHFYTIIFSKYAKWIYLIEHNLKGPSLSHVTACAASTHALSDAMKTIVLGGAERILVVGAESAVCGAGVGGFAAMKALSTRNDDPKNLQDLLI